MFLKYLIGMQQLTAEKCYETSKVCIIVSINYKDEQNNFITL